MIWLGPAGVYLLKVNNRNTRKRCEICSKLTIKTPEQRQWRRCGVFVVNFEHISYLVPVFLLSTLNMQLPAGVRCTFRVPKRVKSLRLYRNFWIQTTHSDLSILSQNNSMTNEWKIQWRRSLHFTFYCIGKWNSWRNLLTLDM